MANPMDVLQAEAGKLLLKMAVLVQSELMRKVSLSAGPVRVKRKRGKGTYTKYTTPSKPGEYLRTRTGHLRAGIRYEPTTAAEAGRQGSVRVGYNPNVWYGRYWTARQDQQRRLGLVDLVQELAPRMAGAAVNPR